MQICRVMLFIFIKIALQRFAENCKQHLFGLLLGAVKEQPLTWAKVNPDLCRLMVSARDNELTDRVCWYGTRV